MISMMKSAEKEIKVLEVRERGTRKGGAFEKEAREMPWLGMGGK